MFEMVCDQYKEPEFVALSVANAVDGDKKCGMPYGISSQQIFKEWISRRDKIGYTFGQDLDTIDNADQILMSTDNDHPIAIRLLLASGLNATKLNVSGTVISASSLSQSIVLSVFGSCHPKINR